MKRLLALTLFLATVSPAFASVAGSHHSLLEAEAAFYRQHLPFKTEWRRSPVNPYLVPRENAMIASLPKPFRSHAIGWAGGGNAKTFKTWAVYVFDRDSYAESLSRTWCGRTACGGAQLSVAGNVVYYGSPLAAASRAMEWLRDH